MTSIHPISTPGAPAPAGHYAQAVVHGDTVYVSGILPWDPDDPEAPLGDIEQQTRRVMTSLANVLGSNGVTVFVTDLSDWSTFNEVFAEMLGDHRPARAVVPVLPLKRDAALELAAIAAD